MGKLIYTFSLVCTFLLYTGCETNHVNSKSSVESLYIIGMKELSNYINELDSNITSGPKIIEMRVTKQDNQYIQAEMFLSKPHLKGKKLPVRVATSQVDGDSIFFLLYHTSYVLPESDSLSVAAKLSNYNLMLDNVLDWTTYGEWSTQDYNYLTFIFCGEDMSIYTITGSAERIENGLPFPDC